MFFNIKNTIVCIYISLVCIASNLFSENRFVLIIPLYNEQNSLRLAEYVECINTNLAHLRIAKLHVLYDIGTHALRKSVILKFLKSKHIPVSLILGRATFEQCFDLANSLYPDCPVIISNADIYFNATLDLLKTYDFNNTFLAITRWDVQKDGSLKPFIKSNGEFFEGSQDAWIFKTPIKRFNNARVELGTTWCDGRIAYEAKKEGLVVINPCKSIQCCHLHLSNVRNYKVTKKPRTISATAATYL
jgi:hypothetical protein